MSGKASGCARGLKTRCCVAEVHRVLGVSEMVEQGMRVVFEKSGDQDVSRIEAVDTGGQIEMQRRSQVYVMDLILDGGKKSAGFGGGQSLVTRGRLLCGWGGG